MHFVRPDFTYDTSVLQPIGGFEPHAAVMGTVNAFTMQGTNFQAGGLGRSMAPVRFLGLGAVYPHPVCRSGFVWTERGCVPWRQGNLLGGARPVTVIKASASPLARLYTRIVAWGKGHRVVQQQLHGLRGPAGGFFPGGPRPWAAQQVLPGPSQQMLQLIQMAQNVQPANFAAQNTAAITQRMGCNTRNG